MPLTSGAAQGNLCASKDVLTTYIFVDRVCVSRVWLPEDQAKRGGFEQGDTYHGLGSGTWNLKLLRSPGEIGVGRTWTPGRTLTYLPPRPRVGKNDAAPSTSKFGGKISG